MSKALILGLMVVVICLAGSVSAEPDSLWVGQLNAYYVGNTVFKVPLFYSHDQPLISLAFPMMFVSTGGPIIPDSVTHAGRTYGMEIFQLFFGFSSGDHGVNPDSTCVGLVSLLGELPPGDGIIADLWFSGGQMGDMISFIPIETYGPSCNIDSYPQDPDGGPIHVVTHVMIVPGGTEIICLSSVTGQATHAISFTANVIGTASPFSLEVLSFDGPAHDNEPWLSGDNPWTVTWQTGFNDLGEFDLVLRATDSDGGTVDKSVTITVEELVVDPCDVARGDLNCDGIIDIGDLVFMVDWMFMSGPSPYCK